MEVSEPARGVWLGSSRGGHAQGERAFASRRTRGMAVSGTTRALARGGVRLARRLDSDGFIGEGADDDGRGGRAPRDRPDHRP
jgi:hypothetical protein